MATLQTRTAGGNAGAVAVRPEHDQAGPKSPRPGRGKQPWFVRTFAPDLDAGADDAPPAARLSDRQFRLVTVLEAIARDKSYLWTTNGKLARMMGRSVRSVQAILRELAEWTDPATGERAPWILRLEEHAEGDGFRERVGIVLLNRLDPDLPVGTPGDREEEAEVRAAIGARRTKKPSCAARRNLHARRMKKTAPELESLSFERDEPEEDGQVEDLDERQRPGPERPPAPAGALGGSLARIMERAGRAAAEAPPPALPAPTAPPTPATAVAPGPRPEIAPAPVHPGTDDEPPGEDRSPRGIWERFRRVEPETLPSSPAGPGPTPAGPGPTPRQWAWIEALDPGHREAFDKSAPGRRRELLEHVERGMADLATRELDRTRPVPVVIEEPAWDAPTTDLLRGLAAGTVTPANAAQALAVEFRDLGSIHQYEKICTKVFQHPKLLLDGILDCHRQAASPAAKSPGKVFSTVWKRVMAAHPEIFAPW